MGISTHILDTSKGKPAADVPVTLERLEGQVWAGVASAKTNADGRAKLLETIPAAGVYRLRFDTTAALGPGAFYPSVSIDFRVTVPTEHFHVPLLLSPFGYSTYRGS